MAALINRRVFLLAAGPALMLAVALRPGETQAESPSVADIFIGELEKRLISSYYQRNLVAYWQSPEYQEYQRGNGKKKQKRKALPPGLAKKGQLPPGIAKQLARNNRLPPGLEYRPLPPDLIAELPPLPSGYRYRIVDDRVLLIKAASNLILDVLTVAALDALG